MKTVVRTVSFLIAVVVVISAVFFLVQHAFSPRSVAKISVVASTFPAYDFTRQIAGEKAEVSLLIPPGLPLRSFAPQPEDLITLYNADIFIYTNRQLERWVTELLQGMDKHELIVVEAGNGIPLLTLAGEGKLEKDPYLWLDFANAQLMVDNIAMALAARDPQNKEYYRERGAAYKLRLAQLDKLYRETLESCRQKKVVQAGPFAFAHLFKRYGLEYVPAYDVAVPTTRELARRGAQLRKAGVRSIYFPELVEPTTARILARESKTKLLLLNSAQNVSKEGLERGVTFIEIMEGNLERLKIGLEYQDPDHQGGK